MLSFLKKINSQNILPIRGGEFDFFLFFLVVRCGVSRFGSRRDLRKGRRFEDHSGTHWCPDSSESLQVVLVPVGLFADRVCYSILGTVVSVSGCPWLSRRKGVSG